MNPNHKKAAIMLLLAFSALFSGCSPTSDEDHRTDSTNTERPLAVSGGVGVGNGMITYHSSAYKFQISYPEKLKLTIVSNENISIDNSPLLNSSNAKVSQIEFSITNATEARKLGITTPETLEQYVTDQYPGIPCLPAQFPGASGFFTERRTDDVLQAHYLILTTNGDLVRVDIDANALGNGLSWVAPIVKTFTYDDTPPVVHEIKTGALTYVAGNKGTLLFRATDDFSGFDPNGVSGWFRATSHRDTTLQIAFGGPIQALGNDWYSIEFEIGNFKPEGEYILEAFSITDRAGNETYLAAPTCSAPSGLCGNFYNQAGEVQVPVITLHIENQGPSDTDGPIIHDLTPRSASAVAGHSGTLYFKATDELSGFGEGASVHGWFDPESGPGEVSLATRIPFSGLFGWDVQAAPQLGAQWYSVTFKVSEYLPAGTYNLVTFAVRDTAGNERYLAAPTCAAPGGLCGTEYNQANGAHIPVVKLSVINDGQTDTTKPMIESIELQTPHVVAGEKGAIRFKASDNDSGLDGGSVFGWFQPLGESSSKTIPFSGYFETQLSSVRALGNGWYVIDFHTNEFLKTGKYFLAALAVRDKAGNERYLVAPTCGSGLCGDHYGQSGGIDIPILTLTLIK